MITLKTIKAHCGYQNYDAIRQAWYSEFGKENGFPDKAAEIPPLKADTFLRRLSRPYPNKPDQVIQGSLGLLEGLRKGEAPTMPELQPGSYSKPKRATATVHQNGTIPETKQGLEETARAKMMIEREAEDRAKREHFAAIEQAERLKLEQTEKLLSPWISGLTWGLNYLEMAFLIVGLWYVAGIMGLIAGAFILVLGSIVLLIVRLRGDAGGWAVFAWFVVCSIGGWLVEYPAMLNAVERSGNIVSEDGMTYAGISTSNYAVLITVLMSGSSFAGTCFRYLKSQQ